MISRRRLQGGTGSPGRLQEEVAFAQGDHPVSRIWNSGVLSAPVLAWTMVLPPELMSRPRPAPVSGASPSQTKAWLPATACRRRCR